jgi:hypothetical protein
MCLFPPKTVLFREVITDVRISTTGRPTTGMLGGSNCEYVLFSKAVIFPGGRHSMLALKDSFLRRFYVGLLLVFG